MVTEAPENQMPCTSGAISPGAPANTATASPGRTPAACRAPAIRSPVRCTSAHAVVLNSSSCDAPSGPIGAEVRPRPVMPAPASRRSMTGFAAHHSRLSTSSISAPKVLHSKTSSLVN
ncbi:Uncharacterised protein [Mycobacteroides abscessus subsp. abscessus]|nr:Uncharacterised protein [Mycobacteroides abscessus subsp. abscessus]